MSNNNINVDTENKLDSMIKERQGILMNPKPPQIIEVKYLKSDYTDNEIACLKLIDCSVIDKKYIDSDNI